MSARVIENWADVTGSVLGTRPGQSEKFLELNLQIESADDVKGVANLVAPLLGQTLWVNIPNELVQSLGVQVGDIVQARVRRVTAELAFVHNEFVTVHRLRTTLEASPGPAPSPQSEPTSAESDTDEPTVSKRNRDVTAPEATAETRKESAPAVFVEKGFRFYFSMTDLMNEPPHVHVDKGGKMAKFWLSPVRLSDPGRFTAKEIRQIEHIVSQNEDKLIEKWNLERAKIQ